MSEYDWSDLMFFFVIAAFLSMVTASCAHSNMEKEAIKHGAARYDEHTGAFRWNNEVKP